MPDRGRYVRSVYWAAALTLTATVLAGCSGQGSVQTLGRSIEQMPGVISSTVSYDTTWWGAARNVRLTTVLANAATADQAEAIGKAFAESAGSDLADVDVDLTVDYRVVERERPPLTSTANFHFAGPDRPTVQGVTEALREWLTVAKSSGVQSVGFEQPAAGGPAGSRAVRITVARGAKDTELQALVRDHPDLATATWTVVGGSLTEASPLAADYPEVYTVTGMVPDERLRELWRRIVSSLGENGIAAADTDMSRVASKLPPTNVVVNFPSSRNREQSVATAWLMLPLLQGLPQPARVDFNGDLFTMGGCSGADDSSSGSARQAELRTKFERC
ncbi:hypothetical protein [Mycolicibacterium sp.]|uniref:hypothetical protein n=1 Tax=Mycolicibacterium sp. TaxID=2320850 RepID=UPI0028AF332B|nr:hypothetical protein [Mycolicibacterium sp.]